LQEARYVRILTGPVGIGSKEPEGKEPLETVLKNDLFSRRFGQRDGKGVLQEGAVPVADNLNGTDGVEGLRNGDTDTGGSGGGDKIFKNPFHFNTRLLLTFLYFIAVAVS
jgi:hypothetical protein